MISAIHTLSGADRKAANLVLEALRFFLIGSFISCNKGASKTSTAPLSTSLVARKSSQLTPAQQALVDSIPRDIRTVLSQLGVQPEIIRYACCPSCSHIYPPNPLSRTDPYPHRCTFKEADKPICDAQLVKVV